MKKLLLLLIALVPFTVHAAMAELEVKTLGATSENNVIKYNGEMEKDSVAVMCKLYKGDDEVDYLSSEVNEHKFSGSFTVSESGKYKISCANYEGGDIKSVDVEVIEESAPATSDKIFGYVSLFLISVIAIVGVVIYFKKNTKKD